MTFHLHIRNELWKLFGKKRTYIGFGMFLLVQNLMLVLFHFTPWQHQLEKMLAGNGYLAEAYVSALTVALVMLLPQNMLLMPLYVSLVGGDLVAKEVEDGTLRMILSRPVSRFQVVFAKWLAGVIFAFCLVLVLGGTALAFARIWYPWKGLFAYDPDRSISLGLFSAGEGFKLYAGFNLLVTVNAVVILSLAFMFSCFNMKPAAATILALSALFGNWVVEMIPFLERYYPYMLIYHMWTSGCIYAQPIAWAQIGQSLCVLLAFGATTFLVGAAAFQTRDIKS